MTFLNQTPDTKWVRQAFILPENTVSQLDRVRMVFSSTKTKFTDTTIGGNWAINSPPQFTQYADIVIPGMFAKSQGMGRFYSEAVDDTGQKICMQFGVPEFNSLESFFTGFYNGEAGLLARTGRSRSVFYSIGRVVGFIVSLPALPIIAAGVMYRFLAGKPASKYYYLKSTMPLYWNAVNTMVNTISVNMGVVPRVFTPEEESMYPSGPAYTKADVDLYHKMLPDIYASGGGIDVYALATRAQRLANENHAKLTELIEASTDRADLVRRIQEYQKIKLSDPGSRGAVKYLAQFVERAAAKPPESQGGEAEAFVERTRTWYADIGDFALGELRDGANYVSFRVDHTGTAGESFSSSVRDSDIASKINGMSSGGRSKRFTFMGGNLTDGVVGDTIEKIMGAVTDVVTGVMDQIGVSGLATMAGSAFVDIPKHWESSMANLPKMDYTIQLRTPYGHPLARLQNLIVPLSMLLAGALPLATGKQSYTSPFICQLFSKGRAQTRLGMITDISITRGVGNLGWTEDDHPLGIDVTFSVTDMSSILYMPINAGPSLGEAALVAASAIGAGAVVGVATAAAGPVVAGAAAVGAGGIAAAAAAGLFDEDNTFTDYMAVLGSLSMADQVYSQRKLRLSMTRKLTAYNRWLSPAHVASWTFGTPPGRILQALSQTTDRK